MFSSPGESHSNAEEDKVKPKVKEQEYYYADYVKRIGRVSEEQYKYGLAISKLTISKREPITFHPEIHNQELFEQMMKEREENKKQQQEQAS